MKSIKFFQFYLANPWRIVQQLKYKWFLKRNPGVPWMAPNAIEFLDKTINKNFLILEWGSGGSTIWFAQRAKKVISIENNKFWFERISKTLLQNHIENVDYRYLDADEAERQDECIAKGIIPPYVAVIHEFKDNDFDMVIVDGALRNICIHSVPKYIRPGGYLVVDNSNWMSPEQWGIPKGWQRVHHHDVGVSCTTVWQKPF